MTRRPGLERPDARDAGYGSSPTTPRTERADTHGSIQPGLVRGVAAAGVFVVRVAGAGAEAELRVTAAGIRTSARLADLRGRLSRGR